MARHWLHPKRRICGGALILRVGRLLALLCLLRCSRSAVTSVAALPTDPPSTNCTLTFAALYQSSQFAAMNGLEGYVSLVHRCPLKCISATVNTTTPPTPTKGAGAVYGSFPYHSASSICLAAIHCGVISDSSGGSVFISRFLRQDWSDSPTQTVFPQRSAYGTQSNGVVSLNVSTGWYTQPADEWEASFTVRGRGDFVSQRRTAPFSPRAHHSHVFWADPYNLNASHWLSQLRPHLIVGGYDGTQYLVSSLHCTQPSQLSAHSHRCCACSLISRPLSLVSAVF